MTTTSAPLYLRLAEEAMFHALEDVVGWSSIKSPEATWRDGAAALVNALLASGEPGDFEDFAGERAHPGPRKSNS